MPNSLYDKGVTRLCSMPEAEPCLPFRYFGPFSSGQRGISLGILQFLALQVPSDCMQLLILKGI